MTKVSTQVARKDYPTEGIAKGDTYYSWTPGFRGRLQRSKNRPRPSQLTANEKLSRAYSIVEDIEDMVKICTVPQDLIDCLDTAEVNANEVADEYQESFDNMPEGLQQGDIGQDLEAKASSLQEFAEQCSSASSEISSLEPQDYVDSERLAPEELENVKSFDDLNESEKEDMLDAARDLASNCMLDF